MCIAKVCLSMLMKAQVPALRGVVLVLSCVVIVYCQNADVKVHCHAFILKLSKCINSVHCRVHWKLSIVW